MFDITPTQLIIHSYNAYVRDVAERVREDGVSTTESMRRHLLSQLENQKKLHEEMIDMMKADIRKLHASNDKLKEDFRCLQLLLSQQSFLLFN